MSGETDYDPDPEPGDDFVLSEPEPRKRGRPKGSRNLPKDAPSGTQDAPNAERPKRRKGASRAADIDQLAQRISGYYQLAAVMMQSPEMLVSDAQARALAVATTDLSDELGVQIGGRFAVIATFIGTVAVINVPKFVVISQRLKASRAKAARKKAEANAHDPHAFHVIDPPAV